MFQVVSGPTWCKSWARDSWGIRAVPGHDARRSIDCGQSPVTVRGMAASSQGRGPNPCWETSINSFQWASGNPHHSRTTIKNHSPLASSHPWRRQDDSYAPGEEWVSEMVHLDWVKWRREADNMMSREINEADGPWPQVLKTKSRFSSNSSPQIQYYLNPSQSVG